NGGEMGGVFTAKLDRVGDGSEAAGIVDAFDSLSRREAFFGKVRSAGGAQIDVEGLPHAGDAAIADDGFGDVRPADDDFAAGLDTLAGDRFDLLHGNFAAELIEAGDDF